MKRYLDRIGEAADHIERAGAPVVKVAATGQRIALYAVLGVVAIILGVAAMVLL